MTTLENWLHRFIQNQELNLEHVFSFEIEETIHTVVLSEVVEQILKQKQTTQIAIQATLFILELKQINENKKTYVLEYFEDLARGMKTEQYSKETLNAIKYLKAQGFKVKKL